MKLMFPDDEMTAASETDLIKTARPVLVSEECKELIRLMLIRDVDKRPYSWQVARHPWFNSENDSFYMLSSYDNKWIHSIINETNESSSSLASLKYTDNKKKSKAIPVRHTLKSQY